MKEGSLIIGKEETQLDGKIIIPMKLNQENQDKIELNLKNFI